MNNTSINSELLFILAELGTGGNTSMSNFIFVCCRYPISTGFFFFFAFFSRTLYLLRLTQGLFLGSIIMFSAFTLVQRELFPRAFCGYERHVTITFFATVALNRSSVILAEKIFTTECLPSTSGSLTSCY